MIVHNQRMQSSKWFKSDIATVLFIRQVLRDNKIELYGCITNALDVFVIYLNICLYGCRDIGNHTFRVC